MVRADLGDELSETDSTAANSEPHRRTYARRTADGYDLAKTESLKVRTIY